MGYSKVQIYNLALVNLGVSAMIQNTAQGGVECDTLNIYYNIALEQVLKDYDWGFAKTYASLTPTGNTCLNPKYQYEYDYPNKCLSAREVLPGEKIEFEIASAESGQIVINTNISPATLRYTRMIDSETFLTSEFVTALSWFLAFLTAETITGSTGKREKALAIYQGLIQKAMAINATEGYEEIEEEADWLEAR